jgi:Icc-related predicted phosphoesterase
VKIVAGVTDPDHAIFNFHVPPNDSGLDSCYAVNEKLEVVTELGQPKLIGAGSSAVREIITRLQPVVSLHGHIHESRGMARIGRTMAFNPGSEYSEGILRGVLVSLHGNEIDRHQFTSG